MVITLLLQRIEANEVCTHGSLTVGSLTLCTLEPPYRPLGVKPRAIPAGTYQIKLRESQHNGCIVPGLLAVPDFDNVEIHILNFVCQTLGCIGVGLDFAGEAIEHSTSAFQQLMGILSDSSVTSIQITIVDPL